MAKSKKQRKMRPASTGANGSTSIMWMRNTAQPPPVSNKQSYIKRKLVLELNDQTSLKISDISTAMGNGGGDFCVDRISIWAKPTTLFASATFTCNSSVLMTSSGALDSLEVVDSGSGTSRPGVIFNVPVQRRLFYSKSTSDTTVVATCAGVPATFHVDVTQYVSS
jgi:hypothetical protein